MNYIDALAAAISEAPPATGLTRAELVERIDSIGQQLVSPCGDAQRIMLCADRASLRKALAALPADVPKAAST